MAEKDSHDTQVKKENLPGESDDHPAADSQKVVLKKDDDHPADSQKVVIKKESTSQIEDDHRTDKVTTNTKIALNIKKENILHEEDDAIVKKENLSEEANELHADSKAEDVDSKDGVLTHYMEKLSLGTKNHIEKPIEEEKPKKKLLIFNLNGLLIHKVHVKDPKTKAPRYRRPDRVFATQSVYKRPFVEEFLNFCLERFEVAIWSSAIERNIDGIMDKCFNKLKNMPLFIWDQKYCSDYGFHTLEKKGKPLFFKDLKKVWSSYSKSEKGPFTSKNTLLIDDSPNKALINPANTGIFPATYNVHDPDDNALDPKGELATWLNGLFHAEDVPTYVAANPFGQPRIKEGHSDWSFYSKILCNPTVAAHLSTE